MTIMPVDLSRSIHAALEKVLKRARQARDQGRTAEAAAAYRECARLSRRFAQYAVVSSERLRRQKQAASYDDLAKQLAEAPPPAPPEAPSADTEEIEDEYEAKAMSLIHKSTVTWDDIGGLKELKRDIRSAYALSLARKPTGVELSGWRHILLFGPPGTGKTLIAAATSNELEATFFSVKVGDMLSQYFGESTKLVGALFAAARQHAPAVVFLDEFDSLGASRDVSDSGAERRLLAQLLSELDGLAQKGDDRYVLTIAATNAPWLLDSAVLSRLEKKVYVPLPDGAAREQILRIHLTGKGHTLSCEYGELVSLTEGLSGRELKRLCTDAVARMVGEVNPDLDETADAGQKAVREYQVRVRALALADFQTVRCHLNPATGPDAVARFQRWHGDATA